MLQSKTQYQKKIDELHQQIEEAAIELQRVREEIESHKKERDGVVSNISKLRDDIVSINNDLLNAEDELHGVRSANSKELKEHESRIEDRKSQIARLEKRAKELEEKVSTLNSVKEEVKKERAILKGIGEDIGDLVSEKAVLESQVSSLEKEKTALNKDISQARNKADKILESANLTARDAHRFYNSIGPWISAIAQWHAVHGENMPELLHNWKPKTIVVSSRIHKVLKHKQK